LKISVVRTVYATVVLLGIVYAFVVLRGPNGIPGLLDRRRQVREYEQANRQLHQEIEQKQERIKRLRESPTEQEFEIRQRLKFARPDEKVYIIEDGNR
jgi:cell division protein FtsB